MNGTFSIIPLTLKSFQIIYFELRDVAVPAPCGQYYVQTSFAMCNNIAAKWKFNDNLGNSLNFTLYQQYSMFALSVRKHKQQTLWDFSEQGISRNNQQWNTCAMCSSSELALNVNWELRTFPLRWNTALFLSTLENQIFCTFHWIFWQVFFFIRCDVFQSETRDTYLKRICSACFSSGNYLFCSIELNLTHCIRWRLTTRRNCTDR